MTISANRRRCNSAYIGSRDDVGGAPINYLCLSMSAPEYEAVLERLFARGVELKFGGEDVFGAQGQAVRPTYFNDLDGNVLEVRFYQ